MNLFEHIDIAQITKSGLVCDQTGVAAGSLRDI